MRALTLCTVLVTALGTACVSADDPTAAAPTGVAAEPGSTAAPSLAEGPTHPELRDELMEMMRVDQEVRTGQMDPERAGAVDAANTARLKEIIADVGWPGRSMVGGRAAQAAFLIAQHADRDVEFQQSSLALMKAAGPGEVSPADLAYLTDRVRVNTGQPQVYGTQFWMPDGELVPQPIEDEANVDARRAAVGLDTLDEYRALLTGHNR